MSAAPITAEALENDLIALCEANPNKRNPVVEGQPNSCFYTSPNNPDEHCIVAQWALGKGLDVPDSYEGGTVSIVAQSKKWPLEDAAVARLDRWQACADLFDDADLPRTWGEVLNRMTTKATS